jgi:Lon protease-like protein
MNEDLLALQNFKGVARLFPLPNLVLFPFVLQGLHVFEPRYRQLTKDALADDRLLAPVLLKPGWESDYEGRPAVHPVACLGRILTEQRLEDGRYNLQLRGLCRVRILEELITPTLYRSARVELLPDINVLAAPTKEELRRDLARVAPPWFPAEEPEAGVFRKLLQSKLSLGMMCDVMSFALPIALEVKQELLEIGDVEQRIRKMIRYLESHQPPQPAESLKFPPDFSQN